MELSSDQAAAFDRITADYTAKARAAYQDNAGDKQKAQQKVADVFAAQDVAIQALVSPEQFDIYSKEIKIEREGREKYNMTLIRDELQLDSLQLMKYDLANEAFYKLLIDNHDNYHGKPDVYRQYYAEIDKSRQQAFVELMTDEQYDRYVQLADQYGVGKSEAY